MWDFLSCSEHHFTCCRNPLHCIVPPWIEERLIYSSRKRVRAAARQNLKLSRSFRAKRAFGRLALPPLHIAPPELRWLQRLAATTVGLNRTIYDARNQQRLPGLRVRSEDDTNPAADAAVDEAYDGLGDTYNLYSSKFERDSLDGAGMPLRATVHFGRDYDNAYWSGRPSNLMVFGDGDGELFNRFTIAVDVIGHELTHGVTENESGLIYYRQPGALNEHLSDVFGSLVKQCKLNQTAAAADWLIGEGLFTNAVQSGQPGVPAALRSMKAPGTAYDDPEVGSDPQPAHMNDYVVTSDDNGGVHINSGILNHAFYLAATRLGGHAWERAGRIWYVTMTSPSMRRTETFQSFANKTVNTSASIYGVDSPEEIAVRTSWQDVGISVPAMGVRQYYVGGRRRPPARGRAA